MAERDLERLLAGMNPERQPGEYVFCSVGDAVPEGLATVATMRETEGLSVVITRLDADAHGLAYEFVAAWITLTIHSALDAVGLTAEVTRCLTDQGISANVIAGYFHDHVFVPADRADEAIAALELQH